MKANLFFIVAYLLESNDNIDGDALPEIGSLHKCLQVEMQN